MKAIAALAELEARINARSRRERLLLAAAVAVVVFVAWDMTLRAPLVRERTQAVQQIAQSRQQLSQLRASEQQLRERIHSLSGQGTSQRVQALRKQIGHLDQELQRRTRRVISPVQMVRVLRDMLREDKRLRLISLHDTGVEPLITQDKTSGKSHAKTKAASGRDKGDATAQARGVPRVYRHQVELVVEGRYFALLDYLQRLEGLKWQFQWDALRIETVHYPTARATIDLSTLSLAQDWLGV